MNEPAVNQAAVNEPAATQTVNTNEATQENTQWQPLEVVGNGKRFPVYYDFQAGTYWIQDIRGVWIKIVETSLRRHLKGAGFCSIKLPGEHLSELDQELNRLQRECNVDYAGPLAGYSIGLYEEGDKRFLVTSQRSPIEPKEGEWPILKRLCENLFDDPRHDDQRPYVFGWLKIAMESLAAGQRRPGQLLVLAGEAESGKSLFQELLTEMLGGRAAKPYRYMSGGSQFNGELFGAEHLLLEDDIASVDIRLRRTFGNSIKVFTVNDVQSCQFKHREAFSARPFWRLSLSVNCEPENLNILPPLDDSLKDKLILLKVRKMDMPMLTHSDAQRKLFRGTLSSELPAFFYYLKNWQIPTRLQSERFGVKHYHHPELLQNIDSIAPEIRLLELIDNHFWPSEPQPARIGVPIKPVTMTAQGLEEVLITSDMSHAVKKLLYWAQATGTYLGLLAKKFPERVKNDRTATSRFWTVYPPGTGAASGEAVASSFEI